MEGWRREERKDGRGESGRIGGRKKIERWRDERRDRWKNGRMEGIGGWEEEMKEKRMGKGKGGKVGRKRIWKRGRQQKCVRAIQETE